MNGLSAALDDVVTRIREATGMRVVDQLSEVNPPCLWVLPPAGTLRFGKTRATVGWTAYLVSPNASTRHAVAALGTLLDTLTTVGLPLLVWENAAVQPLDGGDPHPALRLTWNATIIIGEEPTHAQRRDGDPGAGDPEDRPDGEPHRRELSGEPRRDHPGSQ